MLAALHHSLVMQGETAKDRDGDGMQTGPTTGSPGCLATARMPATEVCHCLQNKHGNHVVRGRHQLLFCQVPLGLVNERGHHLRALSRVTGARVCQVPQPGGLGQCGCLTCSLAAVIMPQAL